MLCVDPACRSGPSPDAAGLFGAQPHTGFPPRTRNLELVGNSGAPYLPAEKTASAIPLRRPESVHLYGLWLVPASGSTQADENQRSMSLAGKGLGLATMKLPWFGRKRVHDSGRGQRAARGGMIRPNSEGDRRSQAVLLCHTQFKRARDAVNCTRRNTLDANDGRRARRSFAADGSAAQQPPLL